MDAGFVKVLVTPNVQAIPVALAAQSASLLAYSADELQRAIRELTLTNPMVEPAEDDDPYYDLISSIPARRETLAEHLSAQLRMTLKDPTLLRVCLLLANSLDANGYLRDDEVGLCRDFSCDAALFHRALRHIQALEPAGVGARSLSECLCLQLQAMGDPDPLAALIAREHLEALARGTLSLPGVSVATTDAAVALLLSLEPRPGSAFDHEATVFVVPDVAVHLQDGALAVSLVNQPHIPALNAPYTALMAQVSPQDRQYLQEQLAYARSFLYAVQQRSSTLLCVAAYAVQQQAAHLMEPQHCPLRRLTQSEAAAALGLSVSTVSRAVNDKYLQYENRVMPLKALFTAGGCANSSKEEIMSRIRQICQQGSRRPSDNTIAQQLAREGIRISRRTVSKYRHAIEDEGGAYR